MNRLKNMNDITYDTMLIVYYCFNIKNHQLIEYTNKVHKLTEFLIRNNSNIVVPKFVFSEIRRTGIRKFIDDYIKQNQITNLPKNPNMALILGLEYKVQRKLNELKQKEWFLIEDYQPSNDICSKINQFFENSINDKKLDEFLKLKNRNDPKPSMIDILLIGFSKERNTALISNDYDLTFFADELYKKGLAGEIFNLKELEIYNN